MGWKSSPQFRVIQHGQNGGQLYLGQNDENRLPDARSRKRRNAVTPCIMEHVLHSENLQSVLNIYNSTRRNSGFLGE